MKIYQEIGYRQVGEALIKLDRWKEAEESLLEADKNGIRVFALSLCFFFFFFDSVCVRLCQLRVADPQREG
jgi:hypothetical protein